MNEPQEQSSALRFFGGIGFLFGSLAVLIATVGLCINKLAPSLRHLVHDGSILNMLEILAIALLCGFIMSFIWSIYCVRITMWIWSGDRGWITQGKPTELAGAEPRC